MARQELLILLAQRLASIQIDQRSLRVAIDGIDAAGKTTLADELMTLLTGMQRRIIRASIDSFHHPSTVRYRQGRLSPCGYYEDSFNYKAVVEHLLKPLGPGGSRLYRTSTYDYLRDQPLLSGVQMAPSDSILLFDGIFLLRDEIKGHWDYTIFLEISFQTSLQRGLKRESGAGDSNGSYRQLFEQRYRPGQQLYLDACDPASAANTVILNEPINQPRIKNLN